METIILGYIVVFFFSCLFSRRRTGVLSCGLFGVCLKPGYSISGPVIQKLKILGLFNEKRGEHSCGYYNGVELRKGVDKNKKFTDFVMNEGIREGDGVNNVFIGHVRHATIGEKTEENAHPFNINDSLILAHNGTLSNAYTLGNKYGIAYNDWKVDSQLLGMLLDKVGYKVLEEYTGYAALLVHRLEEPGVLYLYHGASREKSTDKDTLEERPLYYLETAEGVYVSSLAEALWFIVDPKVDGSDAMPLVVDYNRIVRIKNGRIYSTKLYVNRDDMNIKTYPVNNYYHDAWKPPVQQKLPLPASNNGQGTAALSAKTFVDAKDSIDGIDIVNEAMPPACFETGSKIFYWKGRYWLDWDKLAHGVLNIGKDGTVHEVEDSTKRVVKCYLWNGVMLKNDAAYLTIMKAVDAKTTLGSALTNPENNFAFAISPYSKYPVSLLTAEAGKFDKTMWWKDSKGAKDAITPLFSNRNYHFKFGKLLRIGTKDENDKEIFFKKPEVIEAEVIEDKLPNGAGAEYPPEVYEAAKYFRQVFSSSVEALDELEPLCFEALMLYATDLCSDVMGVSHTDEDMLKKLVDKTIDYAVKQKCTIEEIMDKKCADVESYLLDAFDEDTIYEQMGGGEEEEATPEEGMPWEASDKEVDFLEDRGKIIPLYSDKGYRELVESPLEDIDKAEEEGQAVEKCRELIKGIESIRKISDSLQMMNSSDMAQNVCFELYRTMDGLKETLKALFQDNKQSELVGEIRKTMTLYN